MRKKALLEKIHDEIKRLGSEASAQEIIDIIYKIPYFDWVGIYLLDDKLVLYYYRGPPTPHREIALGEGICGSVASIGESVIVNDVSKAENYIPCSESVKSEIVVPIKKGGDMLGVLDVDSNQLAAFDKLDQEFLEGLASLLSQIL